MGASPLTTTARFDVTPTYAPDSLEALVHSRRSRADVHFDGGNLKIFARKLSFRYEPVLIDIADVEAIQTRTGSFTRFLDTYEKLGLFVETVVNPHLARFLERRGYARTFPVNAAHKVASYWCATDDAGMGDELRALAERLRADGQR